MIKREEYLRKLQQLKDQDIIKVVTGIRRSGKSTLLRIFRAQLRASGVADEQIIALNLEEEENSWLLDRHKLHEYITKKMQPGKMNYIFLDEIQNVPGFEQTINSLHVKKNADVYITGSNAFLLSGELATFLSGRYIEISILPFSFREFNASLGESTNLNERFSQYIHTSSFPKAVDMLTTAPGQINDYLRGVYQSVLKKDIIARQEIKNERSLENVVKFVFDSVGSPLSPNHIADMLTASGQPIKRTTVDSYLAALTNSFVLYKADRWDVKGKKILVTQEKYYAVDVGLRRVLLGRHDEADLGHILENIVYLELRRRGGEIYIGKTGTGKEIDFVVKSPDGDISYYQVAYSVMNEETLARELAPLQQTADHYPKYLITMDPLPFDESGIKHLNALEFLLSSGN